MFSVEADLWDAALEGMKKFFYYNPQLQTRDELNPHCKECHGNSRHRRTPGRYGREALLEKQKGKCAICQVEVSFDNQTAATDHDHATGVIRGILCRDCNSHLGWIEKEDWLDNALAYLEKYKCG